MVLNIINRSSFHTIGCNSLYVGSGHFHPLPVRTLSPPSCPGQLSAFRAVTL
ncbi:unnamed protein product [Staurois parvus]|uniref:Uncharacterized protein n=1 Tax=Staurois parvus TaxID=386267 RepID=A0ABN9AJK4_9NEOB|nr:unnamed protein product [Staurois parvus]